MRFPWLGLVAGAGFVCILAGSANGAELSPLANLGKQIFFDTNLSTPVGQSCASCHSPETGFTSPESAINARGAVHPGARTELFGNRKPPTVAYASFSPAFSYDSEDEVHVGGQFWDGRASTLADQATKPLLNPVEQNNADAADLLKKLALSSYRTLFEQVHGPGSLTHTPENEQQVLARLAAAIAAYESSSEVNPFSSKYDAYLTGWVKLTPQEMRGLNLFEGKANCAECHPNRPGEDGRPPLLTDFTYDNLGLPRNPQNPFYQMPAEINPDGDKYVDLGLGAILNDEEHHGKFKVPTLRNVDRRPQPGFVKAYGHNGTFKSLKAIVHFYNMRDATPEEFPPSEYPKNVNTLELGSLGLTDTEEDDIVAFLKTLTDGYELPKTAEVENGTPAATDDAPAFATDDISSFEGVRGIIRVLRFEQQQRVAKDPQNGQRRR